MMENILNYQENQWMEINKKLMETLNMDDRKLHGSKYSSKNYIKSYIHEYFKEQMEQASQNKSKIEFLLDNRENWQPGKPAGYIKQLTRKQASTIFRARTRMLQVKNNFRNAHEDLICRMCKNSPETQIHILQECKAIHKDPSTMIKNEEIFTEDKTTLKIAAEKIANIQENLQKNSAAPDKNG